METAREYFERVKAAHAIIDSAMDKLYELQAGPAITQQYTEAVAHTPEPLKLEHHVVRMLTMEDVVKRQHQEQQDLINEAKARCCGLQLLHPNQQWGRALHYYYCDNMIQKAVAQCLCMSLTKFKDDGILETALDMVDHDGFARCEEAYQAEQDKLVQELTAQQSRL